MKNRKWRLVVSIVLAFALSVLFSGCVANPRPKIAVIPLSGSIAGAGQQSFLMGAVISPGLVRDYLDRAESDFLVKAVVLRIDSPGGSAAASQEIASTIRNFKETTGKPVVISMGDQATSGGYYISAYADRIVANPSTLTGNIGVISQFIYIEGFLEKLGMEMEIIKSGEYKDMGLRPLSPAEREIMQIINDELYGQFISTVAEGRKLSISDVEDLATGQIYTGTQALSLGLVDELGGLDRATELAEELAGVTGAQIEEYRPSSSFFLSLLQGLQQKISWTISGDEALLLRTLTGWQGYPKY